MKCQVKVWKNLEKIYKQGSTMWNLSLKRDVCCDKIHQESIRFWAEKEADWLKHRICSKCDSFQLYQAADGSTEKYRHMGIVFFLVPWWFSGFVENALFERRIYFVINIFSHGKQTFLLEDQLKMFNYHSFIRMKQTSCPNDAFGDSRIPDRYWDQSSRLFSSIQPWSYQCNGF